MIGLIYVDGRIFEDIYEKVSFFFQGKFSLRWFLAAFEKDPWRKFMVEFFLMMCDYGFCGRKEKLKGNKNNFGGFKKENWINIEQKLRNKQKNINQNKKTNFF